MGRINRSKLIAGGILAGVVMNICDYVSNNFILAADWEQIARIRNVDMGDMSSPTALVTYVVVDMLLGFLVVWTYAAIRPRFGQGPGTAVRAGLAVFFAQALLMASYAVSFLTWDVFIRGGLLLLVSVLAGALAGSWVYAEEDSDR
ncbi:MAG TPA: hypothetical protein VIX35_06020 [Vicinamibacterales bacterium]